MKFFVVALSTFLFLLLLVLAVFYYPSYSNSNKEISSPLPNLLFKNVARAQEKMDFWMPSLRSFITNSNKKPHVEGKAALSYDLSTSTLIYEKNINEKVPIASLTKLMTAIVALENGNISDEITVPPQAATVGEDSMGLTAGEKLTLKELLYGLFLNSGNDAAEALAQKSTFGRENFIYLMNKKAEDLGLTATHFTNPSGLQGDGKQYSTAYDLLVLTKYALEKSVISEIVQLPYYFIPYTSTHKAYELYNETNLLTSYPGVKGVKTGYTDEAGLCLITYLDYKGHRIIAILLNSQNRRQEMKDILDFSLKSLGVTPPAHG